MKQISIAIFVMAWTTMSTIKAQTTDTSVANAINHAFAPLEKNRVPHGILLDYGFDFTNLNKYNGVNTSGDHINPALYRDIYTTIVSSAIQSGVSGIQNPKGEYNKWKNLQQQKTAVNTNTNTHIVLSGLYFKFSKIRTNALSQGDIRVINNSTQYDDAYSGGVWQNPYETKNAVAIGTRVLEINTPKVTVSLPTSLLYSNQKSTIQSIKMSWGEGLFGFYDITNGKEISYTYQQPGIKTWDFQITLTNGTVLRTRLKVNIKNGTGGVPPKANPGCSEVCQKITATRAYKGKKGSATLQVIYGSSDCRMRNPLIIAEGLDTGLQAESGSIGDTDYEIFRRSIENSNSTELRNLITRNTAFDYDVIYVNWDNGTDYLQRNAFVLEEVIKWVNSQKVTGSTTSNVIIGQSMGGLITRYALKDMENRGEDHQTSLYVSHDAPHQGAHIPLSVQYMTRHLIDRFISTPLSGFQIDITEGGASVEDLRALLDAPAVRQLVFNYVNGRFEVDNSLFDDFQKELHDMGYPEQTRNIAISNGNHCAEKQQIAPGERIFNLDGRAKSEWLTDITLALYPLLNSVVTNFLTIVTEDAGFLLNTLPGKSKLTFDFRANAYPESGTKEVYFGRIRYTKKLLWLIDIDKTITQKSFNSQPGILPIETYPGGGNPLFNADLNFDDVNNALINVGFNADFNPNFNFIPAASALDVGSGRILLNAADYTRSYSVNNAPTSSRAIPFTNFTTSFNTRAVNEPHISFNRLNGDWLAEEMDRDADRDIFDCTFGCTNTVISGSDRVCTTATFSMPAGATNYTWTITEGAIITGNGTNRIVVSSNNKNSTATLSVEVTTSCGRITIERTIRLGKPQVRSITVPSISVDQTSPQSVTYRLSRYIGVDTYRLVSNHPDLLIDSKNEITFQDSNFVSRPILFTVKAAGLYTATLYVTNTCGTSESTFLVSALGFNDGSFSEAPSNDFKGSMKILYPNPASDQVTIFLDNLSQKKISELPKEIRAVTIIDPTRNGATAVKISQHSNKLTFPIYNLKPGLYLVKIETEFGILTEKLIVE